ncbi:CoA-binding protein [Herbivorax sp. ANBcel31]|uniref:CoA-binding protein n=1 Tax=Herbivorax sp. ANBcel31 TaxID=3069754 RepID=UPI0027B85C40|nr:CoA-binding protein [Herbivorax sp. ANBcel31]MDQ2086420.1 CoA-binding protein [Herbivorax sp. ANBcel31]
MLEEKMLEKKVWAVVGANENAEKYGNMIYKKLKLYGYTVYPVNPKYEEIEGDKCYEDLSSLPEKPDVIDMVVSPKRGKAVIEEAAKLGIDYIWLQPGTHNDEIMDLIQEKGITAVKACVLVALR